MAWSFAFSANPESDINVWISTVVKVKALTFLIVFSVVFIEFVFVFIYLTLCFCLYIYNSRCYLACVL